jgi:aminoglycoside 6'-N-acetyltransferase I
MTIRPVEPRDRAEWLRMRAALWPDESLAGLEAEVDVYLGGAAEEASMLSAVHVADGGAGRLAGFVELSVRNYAEGCAGPTPYVEGWYVEPERRGVGVGRALIGAAEDWARERGYAEIASDTTLENEASRRAHAALGFEEVERIVVFRKGL